MRGTEAGAHVVRHGVTLIGPVNLPASMPVHASQMYAKNISTFLDYLIQDDQLNLDFEDDIPGDTCVTFKGEIRNERVRQALEVTSVA